MPMTRLSLLKTNYEIRQIIDASTLFGKGFLIRSKLILEKTIAMEKKKADYPFHNRREKRN